MKPFKRVGAFSKSGGGRKFGAKPFGGGGSFGGRDGGSGQMFETVCAECGGKAEVPFRPNGRKPVLCRECFGQGERAPQERSEPGAFGRAAFAAKRPFDGGPRSGGDVEKSLKEINMKLDRIIKELDELREEDI